MNSDLLFIQYCSLQECICLTKSENVDIAYFTIGKIISDKISDSAEKNKFLYDCLDNYINKLKQHNYWESNIVFKQNSPLGIIEYVLNIIVRVGISDYFQIILKDIDRYTGNYSNSSRTWKKQVEYNMIKILATIPQADSSLWEAILKEPYFTILRSNEKYYELIQYCLDYQNVKMLEYLLLRRSDFRIDAVENIVHACIQNGKINTKMAYVFIKARAGDILELFIEELFIHFSTQKIDKEYFEKIVNYYNVSSETLKNCAKFCYDCKNYEMYEWINLKFLGVLFSDHSYILKNITKNDIGPVRLVNIQMAEEAMGEWSYSSKIEILLKMCLKGNVEAIKWLANKYTLNASNFCNIWDFIRYNKDYSYDVLIWVLRHPSFGLKEMVKTGVIVKDIVSGIELVKPVSRAEILIEQVVKYGYYDDLAYVCGELGITKQDSIVVSTIMNALYAGKLNKAQLLMRMYDVKEEDVSKNMVRAIFTTNIFKGRMCIVQWMSNTFKTLEKVKHSEDEKYVFVKCLAKKGYLLTLQWFIQRFGINQNMFNECIVKASKYCHLYVHEYLLKYWEESLENKYLLALTSYGAYMKHKDYFEIFYGKKLIHKMSEIRNELGLEDEAEDADADDDLMMFGII